MSVLICINGDIAHTTHCLYSQPDSPAQTKMPVILASLVFAISLSLLPYTDSQSETEAAEMDRLRSLYLTRRRRSIESRVKGENR